MASALYDLGYIQAGIESLEDYLLSKNLFWPLNIPSPIGEPHYPRLTLGGILLSFARLRSRNLFPSQIAKLRSLESKHDHVSTSKRNAWLRKGKREFLSRLRQWNLYLLDLRETPNDHIAYYGNEVRARVIMDLLNPKIEPLDDKYIEKLNELDTFLAKILAQDEFIWEPDLSNGFNPDNYWYLWGRPSIIDLEFFLSK